MRTAIIRVDTRGAPHNEPEFAKPHAACDMAGMSGDSTTERKQAKLAKGHSKRGTSGLRGGAPARARG